MAGRPRFLCGVVEGFYGRPWSMEQRKLLFEWLGRRALNCYMYAPKDELKHRLLWREPYTEPEAAHMRSLIEAAQGRGVEFVFALSAGQDMVFSSAGDRLLLQQKLRQVAAMGCRAFALLFDDIDPCMCQADRDAFPSLAQAQASVANEVYQELGQPPVFLFCPTEYCSSLCSPSPSQSCYLLTIGRELLPGIGVIWTGPKVVSQELSAVLLEEVEGVLRRRPVIWDNLYANDYDCRRVFLGPYTGRAPGLMARLRGLLLNPNCELQANFIPIHTLGSWFRSELWSCARPDHTGMEPAAAREDSQGPQDGRYSPQEALELALRDWVAEINRQALEPGARSPGHTSVSLKGGAQLEPGAAGWDVLPDSRPHGSVPGGAEQHGPEACGMAPGDGRRKVTLEPEQDSGSRTHAGGQQNPAGDRDQPAAGSTESCEPPSAVPSAAQASQSTGAPVAAETLHSPGPPPCCSDGTSAVQSLLPTSDARTGGGSSPQPCSSTHPEPSGVDTPQTPPGPGAAASPVPTAPLIDGAAATPVPTAPLIDGAGASPVPTAPLIDGAGASPVPTAPLIDGAGASPVPTAPLIDGAGARPVPTAPLIDGAGASPVPTAPLIDGAGARPVPTAPLIDGAGASPVPTAPLTDGAGARPVPTAPLIDGAAASPVPTAPLIDGAAASPVPTAPLIDGAGVSPGPTASLTLEEARSSPISLLIMEEAGSGPAVALIPKEPRSSPTAPVTPEEPRSSPTAPVTPEEPRSSPTAPVTPEKPRSSPMAPLIPEKPRSSPTAPLTPEEPRSSPTAPLTPEEPRSSPTAPLTPEEPRSSPTAPLTPEEPRSSPTAPLTPEEPRSSPTAPVTPEEPRSSPTAPLTPEEPRSSPTAPLTPEEPRSSPTAPVTPEEPRSSPMAPLTPEEPRSSPTAPLTPEEPRSSPTAPVTPEEPRSSPMAPLTPEEPRSTPMAPLTPEEPRSSPTAPLTPEEPRSSPTTPLTLGEVRMLVELFYLPYHHGPLAQHLLEHFRWLRANSLSVGVSAAAPDAGAGRCWRGRAQSFRRLCAQTCCLHARLVGAAGRALLYDLHPYLWDIRNVLLAASAFVQWLDGHLLCEPGPTGAWGSCFGWCQSIPAPILLQGDAEPWAQRGGLFGELQALLPVGNSSDLFHQPPPLFPSRQLYVLRPLQPRDKEDLYRMCRESLDCDPKVTEILVAHPDLLGDRLLGSFLSLSPEYTFVLEDDAGPCGYAAGVLCAEGFLQQRDSGWLPAMRHKYPRDLAAGAPALGQDVLEEALLFFHTEPAAVPLPVLRRFPSLVQLGTAARTLDTGASRSLALCLLSSLRANGSRGVFCQVSATDQQQLSFYSKLGFVALPVAWGSCPGARLLGRLL